MSDAQTQQQRYELVSTLGKGGMAEVFLGWMHSVGGLRRKVAIKRILPDLVQKQSHMFEKMFVDEARLAFQLEHDNITRVYDVGQSAGTFFIVMEYVQGFDLKKIYEKLVESSMAMPLGVCLYIGAQVAAGLAYAHEMTDDEGRLLGLVHNDISPPNILIGRYGEVKVADFGLSDARSNDVVTPDGMVKGKFAYISPESTRDPTLVSARSDIFSVGIVLWELIAGRRLFQKDTDLETFQAVRSCTVPDIRKYRPDVPAPLVTILNKCLAAEPKDRYQSGRSLFSAIIEFSVKSNIPLNRFQLTQVIGELKGHKWEDFIGKRVEQDDVADLQAAMDNLLPPGVAQHLKGFVTGGQVVEDVAEVEGPSEDWVGDVFGDVGFDAGEFSGFDPESGTLPAADAEDGLGHIEPQLDFAGASDLGSVEDVASEVESSVPPPIDPPKNSLLEPAHDPVAAVRLEAERQSQAQTESMMAVVSNMKEEFAGQKMTFIVWGAIGGLVIGAVLGAIIGTLI